MTVYCASEGTKVTATTSETASERQSVIAMSLTTVLVSPCVKRMGSQTMSEVMVEARIAPDICEVPVTTASFTGAPRARRRYIFSITTTELSTSMPIPMASPAMDMRLREMPAKYMMTKVATTLMTMERAVSRVGRRSLRKMKRITTASSAPQSRFSMTVSMSSLV